MRNSVVRFQRWAPAHRDTALRSFGRLSAHFSRNTNLLVSDGRVSFILPLGRRNLDLASDDFPSMLKARIILPMYLDNRNALRPPPNP